MFQMKTATYVREFNTQREAMNVMRAFNETTRGAKRREVRAVVDGPNDNFAVVDIVTAIELGGGYVWEG
jgi:hypothetical protein